MRDLLLGQSVGAPQDSELLAKRSNGLASCLVATLNMSDGLAFDRGINREELPPVD